MNLRLLLRFFCLLFFLLTKCGYSFSQYYINTIAGSGYNGSTGDGGIAVCAGIPYPSGVGVDSKGNVYIASSNRIRKIDVNGTITTIAGSDASGYNGDNIPARDAVLKFPFAICVDKNDNIFFTEYSGSRVRKINTAGIITTVAGNGTNGYSGDGGPATSANLYTPWGLTLDDDGNIYIADHYNSVVRKVEAATGIIRTIAGNGTAGHSGDGGPATSARVAYPAAVAVDQARNVYFIEVWGGVTSRIRKVDAVTGIISTIAGSNVYGYSGDGGLAVNANLFDPSSLTIDKNGNIILVEYDQARIRRIDAATGIISTIGLNGVSGFSGDGGLALSASGYNPMQITIDGNGDIYFADNFNHRVRKLSTGAPPAPPSAPKVTISTPTANPCVGTNIVFTAQVSSAGTNEVYRWYVNGVEQSVHASSFSSSSLRNGDIVVCTYTSQTCAGTSTTATSNTITIALASGQAPVVTLSADPLRACPGEQIEITAQSVYTGAMQYNWFRNGEPVDNHTTTYQYRVGSTTDRIYCAVTTNQTCNPGPFHSDTLEIQPFPVPQVNIRATDTAVSPGTIVGLAAQVTGIYNNISWTPASLLNGSNALTVSTKPLFSSADFGITLTTIDGCSVTAGARIKVVKKLAMPNAFSPNRDHKNDVFRIPPDVTLLLKEFVVYGRWGNKIFSTTDITKGWDGGDYPSGNYVYVITGTEEGKPVAYKGSFLLVR
ncbi:MAG: gliding motility-associated C-terminal domain-containing protein [Niastella sp.]|nr:gliding motility-associated C-terminal domain-containing protein [Niastella sp.]